MPVKAFSKIFARIIEEKIKGMITYEKNNNHERDVR